MKPAIGIAVLLLVFGASLAAGVYLRTQWTPARSAPMASSGRGAMLYTMHCAKCHGDEGHGDAEGAEKLVPPPRNFASRPWRFQPTAESIERVVTEGIPGTSMPMFGATLLPEDIQALTQHVLLLASAGDNAVEQYDPFREADFMRLATPRPASALQLEDASGQRHSLTDFQGKIVLLNFWGVSCDHCLKRMPALATFQQQLADDVVVLNICADEDDAANAQEFLSAAAPQLTTYIDPTGLANSHYAVSLLPTMWLLDRQGNVLAKSQGARDWSDPKLKALLEGMTKDQARMTND